MIDKLLQKLLTKKPKDSLKAAAQVRDEDFIPYVCHYDPNTIVTKNGELMQIIRITGFSTTTAISELVSLREAVRETVISHVQDNKIAFWFNTIRRKKNIAPKAKPKEFFAAKFDEAWIKDNQLDDKYVNEVYITVIVEGMDTSIENIKGFARSFSYLATKSLHREFLKKAHKKLSEIVQGIVVDTEKYGAKLLGIQEWEGVLYSEPMRFFGKVVNLYEEHYPLAANDISLDLSTHKIAFGNRELEVLGKNNNNYAAVLSLKEYFEVSTSSLDNILQLPCEFIITQSFDFTVSKKEIAPQEYQNYILQVSGDEDLRQASGIANFVESGHGSPIDYGKLQTTIAIISHSREDLERDAKVAFEKLNSLGFVAIREDIFLEHCFWSQLPANFRYLRRQKVINTNRIAGFAALHNFPSGSIAGNKWGSAITTLPTILNTSYFFNFHNGDLGHTVIFGSEEFSESTLLNFLVTQSRRVGGKLFYFDFNNSAKVLIKTLGGAYYDMSEPDSENSEFLHLNPLALPKTNENKKFLNEFFASLVAFAGDAVSPEEIAIIPEIVDRIFTTNANNFGVACEAFNTPETKGIYKTLKIWNGENLGHIFGAEAEINWSDKIIAFDLSEIFDEQPLLTPIVNYLLHQMELQLDGSPAALVINDAWNLLDNPVLAPNISAFLERLKQKNCAVILATKDIEHVAKSEISAEINKNLATRIFMPSKEPHKCLQDIFELSEDELGILEMMTEEENDFFFKHNDDAIIASLNLANLVEFAKIFNANEVTLTAMEEVIAAYEDEQNLTPEIWVPQFIEILGELEKAAVEAEKQQLREEAAERRRALKEKLGED
jgi:type IV secretion system protein VirB4